MTMTAPDASLSAKDFPAENALVTMSERDLNSLRKRVQAAEVRVVALGKKLDQKTPVTSILSFVKHPGTGTAIGLALAALAQFTATVPVHDRTTPTFLGFGYALATQLIDVLKSKSTGTAS